MFEILSITFPIFALVGLGYGVFHSGFFEKANLRVLGKFVMSIGLPALLFNAVSQRHLTEIINPKYMLVYMSAGLFAGALIYVASAVQGNGPARRAIAFMGSICPNSGYIGYPIIFLLFPDLASSVLAMNMIVESFVLIPISFVLLEMSRPKENTSVWQSIWSTMIGVLKRPLIIALLVGMAVSLLQIPLPVALTRTTGLLANATAALALIFIGGSLVGLPIRGNRLLASLIVFGKLFLFPAVCAAILFALPSLGFAPLAPELTVALILSSAVPMMGIYSIVAQEYGHDGLASIALLGATVGSFFTLNALLAILT